MSGEDLRSAMEPTVPELDRGPGNHARRRWDRLAKPENSLGRMEEIVRRYCRIRHRSIPDPVRGGVATFAGTHGVVEEGVSAYPPEITGEMVREMFRGRAAINLLSRSHDCLFRVVPVGVDVEGFPDPVRDGTRNFLRAPAMERDEMANAVRTGRAHARDLVNEGCQVLVPGEMGIGNTTSAAAVTAAVLDCSPEEVVGPGSGLSDGDLDHKTDVVTEAVDRHTSDGTGTVEVLRRLGGYEIAAMTGFLLEGVQQRCAMVLDGFISTTAGVVVRALDSRIEQFLFAGHRSGVPGHRVQLEHLGLDPLIDLNLSLGEGTGGVLGHSVLRDAVLLYREMRNLDEIRDETAS